MGIILNRRRICGGGEKPLHEEFVDLGLPSGILWAKGNIVKDEQGNYSIGNETDYGCYFSWGNIDGHNSGEGYSFSSTNYYVSPGSTLTGSINATDAEHDAALARLGNGCRLPTLSDFVEISNNVYTTNVWTTQNGIAGMLVTSKANGNSIFFPASGFNYRGAIGSRGYYWSSTFLRTNDAYNLYFDSNNINTNYNFSRWYGLAVRAVYKP